MRPVISYNLVTTAINEKTSLVLTEQEVFYTKQQAKVFFSFC